MENKDYNEVTTSTDESTKLVDQTANDQAQQPAKKFKLTFLKGLSLRQAICQIIIPTLVFAAIAYTGAVYGKYMFQRAHLMMLWDKVRLFYLIAVGAFYLLALFRKMSVFVLPVISGLTIGVMFFADWFLNKYFGNFSHGILAFGKQGMAFIYTLIVGNIIMVIAILQAKKK